MDVTDLMIRKFVNKQPEDFKPGDMVVYIPEHLLMGERSGMIQENNLGVVSSVNDTHVHVKYNDSPSNSRATKAADLFWINNRPDLIEKLTPELLPQTKK